MHPQTVSHSAQAFEDRDSEDRDSEELARRLPWLLVFRVAVATVLLVVTLAADIFDWPLRRMSPVLYGVVIGTYVVVFALGLLLRVRVSAVVLASVHLVAAVLTAMMVVHATGGVLSAFSFLYPLAILDGAIVGGRRVAVVVAVACCLTYGLQITMQMYDLVPAAGGDAPSSSRVASAFATHLAGFYFIALLSGRLADLWRRAHEEASDARLGLARAAAFHRRVVESLPVGVLTIEAGGVVHMANPAAARILGVADVDHLVGRSVPADIKLPDVESMGQFGALEQTVALEGVTRCLSLAWSPLRGLGSYVGDAGDQAAAVVVIEDRTSVRALEGHLREKERLAAIGELSAAIAHELRNPLASMSGAIEMLREESSDATGRQQRLAEIVLREVERLNFLVVDFLAYARPAPPEKIPVDMIGLVREVCHVLRGDPAWSATHVAMRLPEQALVVVDPAQIRQVLWNLLRNAQQASPSFVEICVECRRGDGLRPPWCLLEVRDRGPGVGEEARKRAFEPFYTTKPNGTGLGLALVHRIVEAHGGEVSLANAQGGGAVARVELPIGADGDAAAAGLGREAALALHEPPS